MSSLGAQAAWRGYRLQALYTLHRILHSPKNQDYRFQPEGVEDLAIRDSNEILTEILQVKSYDADDLQLSHFEPKKGNSFLRRAIRKMQEMPQVTIRVVSFRQLGTELKQAWSGDEGKQALVKKKLENDGYEVAEIALLFTSLEFEVVSELNLKQEIFDYLKEGLLGGDPDSAFDLLTCWLYQVSENRTSITHKSLREKLVNIGKYLAERPAYYQEWYQTIVPLEDRDISESEYDELKQSFYRGVDARYEHILVQADVERPEKLDLLDIAFQKSRLVILRAASGQGKSAVAYRYLLNYVPNLWRFFVHAPENFQHALSIARALDGHARAIGVPMMVYLDVPSRRDTIWVQLLKELSHIHNLHLLVTIREEDWKRANIRRTEFDQIEEIELTFDEAEAYQIYNQLTERITPQKHLTFEDAWRTYGSQGLLLEFVYFVTQQETLRSRLEQQVRALQDFVREGELTADELKLLRWGVVISAFQARIELKKLQDYLPLPEPNRTLQLFEKEYLLRRTADTLYLEGLHSVRSAILVDLLTDPAFYLWEQIVTECLPIIVESDLETFLLHSFSRHYDAKSVLIEKLSRLQLETWEGIGGTLRALLWLGVETYIRANEKLIYEVAEYFGQGWSSYLDGDIANLLAGETLWWEKLSIVSTQMREYGYRVRKRQTPKRVVFQFAHDWLKNLKQPPHNPKTISDWKAFAETLFWMHRLSVGEGVIAPLSSDQIDAAIPSLPLDVVGDVVLALSFAWEDSFGLWYDAQKPQILERFQQETNTIKIEDDSDFVRIHFIPDLQSLLNESIEARNDEKVEPQEGFQLITQSENDQTLWRLDLLQKLMPYRERRYGSQGYGHRIPQLEIPIDDTKKTGIPASHFHPIWAVRVNAIFRELGNWRLRPADWDKYAKDMLEKRKIIVSALKEISRVLSVHFRKQKQTRLVDDLSLTTWEKQRKIITSLSLLPQCTVDEWGFSGEAMQQPIVGSPTTNSTASTTREGIEQYLSLLKYRKYLKTWSDYNGFLSSFLNVSIQTMQTYDTKRTRDGSKPDSVLKEKEASRTVYILSQVLFTLPQFQREFRTHFKKLVSPSELRQLEREELQYLTQCLVLWHQFTYSPLTVWQKPQTEIETKWHKTQRVLMKNVREYLQQLAQKGFQADIAQSVTEWEGRTALCILVDCLDALKLHSAFDHVYEAIQLAINTTMRTHPLVRYLFRSWFDVLIIVPTMNGKALAGEVWKLSGVLVMGDKPVNQIEWYVRTLQPVSPDTWALLECQMWDAPILDMALQLRNAVAALMLVVSHLGEIARPLSEATINSRIAQHINECVETVNSRFQRSLDLLNHTITSTGDHLDQYPEHVDLVRDLLQMLQDLHDSILPSPDFSETGKYELADMAQWGERLLLAQKKAEIIRLNLTLLY
jgi:hypothetical protein